MLNEAKRPKSGSQRQPALHRRWEKAAPGEAEVLYLIKPAYLTFLLWYSSLNEQLFLYFSGSVADIIS